MTDVSQMWWVGLVVLVLGAVLLWFSSKQRTDTGEWGAGLQWGYLLIMMGVFGVFATVFDWSFTAILLMFTLATGSVWLWAKIQHKGVNVPDNNHFRDYMAGFFPIITVVFVVRTFLVEPFQIPSSSMRPGLVKGDFILVNKYTYGIRVPVLNKVLIPINEIKRGDVAVFNYPVDPKVNYIKRIVGVPGDVIEYRDKVLSINGQVETDTPVGHYQYADDVRAEQTRTADRFSSQLLDRQFSILQDANSPAVEPGTFMHFQEEMKNQGFDSGLQEHCHYAVDGTGFTCKVPAGKYFAMGDNRDSSADSRYWGFVDDRLIVGKAFFIWMNFSDTKRIGGLIQ